MNPTAATMPKRTNKPKRNDVPAKIDAEVMRMARLVAVYEETEIAELVSEILRPILQKRLTQHQQRELQKPKGE